MRYARFEPWLKRVQFIYLKLQEYVEFLNEKLPFFSSRMFYVVFSVAVIANPIAVWSQAIKAWTAASTEGISLFTFVIMLTMQFLGTGYGIRKKEPIICLAMLVSFLGSLVIIAAILIR